MENLTKKIINALSGDINDLDNHCKEKEVKYLIELLDEAGQDNNMVSVLIYTLERYLDK